MSVLKHPTVLNGFQVLGKIIEKPSNDSKWFPQDWNYIECYQLEIIIIDLWLVAAIAFNVITSDTLLLYIKYVVCLICDD